jgi:hypothetical protein
MQCRLVLDITKLELTVSVHDLSRWIVLQWRHCYRIMQCRLVLDITRLELAVSVYSL